MRTDKELVELAIEHFSIAVTHSGIDGLCEYFRHLHYIYDYITLEEKERLVIIIQTNKPPNTHDMCYYFVRYNMTLRYDFLQTILKNLNETQNQSTNN